MHWYSWLLYILELPLVWFLWTSAHEASHVIASGIVAKITDVKWWLYPHRDEQGNFYFAKVQWSWDPNTVKPNDLAITYLAPRFMNVIAALALPFAVLFPLPWMIAWIIFWGAGIVDFFVGSMGISEYSDLKRAAAALNINPNMIRVAGFASITLSVVLCFLLIGISYAS